MIVAMRASATEWAERVRAWRESGETAAEFAAGKDFTERTLTWWAGELARTSAGGQAQFSLAFMAHFAVRLPRLCTKLRDEAETGGNGQ